MGGELVAGGIPNEGLPQNPPRVTFGQVAAHFHNSALDSVYAVKSGIKAFSHTRTRPRPPSEGSASN